MPAPHAVVRSLGSGAGPRRPCRPPPAVCPGPRRRQGFVSATRAPLAPQGLPCTSSHHRRGRPTTRIAASSSRDDDITVAALTPRRRSRSRSRTDRSLPTTNDIKSSDTSVLGAVALIMGSTVGAGILALPSVTAAAGFAPSAATLTGVWALLTAEALLLAEVNLALVQERDGELGGDNASPSSPTPVVTLREMAAATLGPASGHFVSAAYLALSYTLMVAYISKAGDLIGGSPTLGATAFTAAIGVTLAAGPAAVDAVNRVATGGLLTLFATIVGGGALHAHWPALAAADWSAAPAAVPVILLSLVFHDLVPVVVAQLRGDPVKVRTALLVGGGLPLAMFVAWDAVALALAGDGGLSGDPLAALAASGGPALATAVAAFSGLALATSALGNALGLTETVAAELGSLQATTAGAATASADADDTDDDDGVTPAPAPASALAAAPTRAAALALVLAPPLIAAAAHPGSFVAALNLAGGYGMTALYGVLPPVMAWRLRGERWAGKESSLSLPGGNAALATLTAAAAAVELGRLQADLLGRHDAGLDAAAVGGVAATVAAVEAATANAVGVAAAIGDVGAAVFGL